jgi:hypothetical protein
MKSPLIEIENDRTLRQLLLTQSHNFGQNCFKTQTVNNKTGNNNNVSAELLQWEYGCRSGGPTGQTNKCITTKTVRNFV